MTPSDRTRRLSPNSVGILMPQISSTAPPERARALLDALVQLCVAAHMPDSPPSDETA